MRPPVLAVLLAVACACAAAGWLLLRGPDGELAACVEQAEEHREDAFTGPVTDEQIEEFCRQVIDGSFLG